MEVNKQSAYVLPNCLTNMDVKSTASMYTVNMNISEASGDKSNWLADIFCFVPQDMVF